MSSCAVQFHYRTHPKTVLTADDGRIRGLQDRTADIILGGVEYVVYKIALQISFYGGLFLIHIPVPGSDGGQCTDAVRDQGIETLEAMLYAIDAIFQQ